MVLFYFVRGEYILHKYTGMYVRVYTFHYGPDGNWTAIFLGAVLTVMVGWKLTRR